MGERFECHTVDETITKDEIFDNLEGGMKKMFYLSDRREAILSFVLLKNEYFSSHSRIFFLDFLHHLEPELYSKLSEDLLASAVDHLLSLVTRMKLAKLLTGWKDIFTSRGKQNETKIFCFNNDITTEFKMFLDNLGFITGGHHGHHLRGRCYQVYGTQPKEIFEAALVLYSPEDANFVSYALSSERVDEASQFGDLFLRTFC